MTRNNKTRHALLMSLMSILLCIAMLIGSTFAWFTDTASTNVGNIVSGTLDVDIIEKDTTNSLAGDGKTLKFLKAAEGAAAAESDTVLWEPGATYQLTPFRITNKGSLALKYKVTINGATGDTKLLDVIDFTIKEAGKQDALATSLTGWTGTLDADSTSGVITIEGTMNTSAGNEYQGLSITGIGITVAATQNIVEYDSSTNTYDQYAEYPIVETVATSIAADNIGDGDKIKEAVTVASTAKASANTEQSLVTVTLPAETKLAENATTVTLTVAEVTDTAKLDAETKTIEVKSNEASRTLEIDLTGIDKTASAEDKKAITVDLFVGKDLNGVKFYHKGDEMKEVTTSKDDVTDGTFFYSKTTGVLTFASSTFSPFTIVFANGTGLDGSGTKASPYLIKNISDFKRIGTLTDTYYYYKVADGVTSIDCSEIGKVNLNGSFDGNGVKLTNITGRLFNIVGSGENGKAVTLKNFTAEMNGTTTAVVFTVNTHTLSFENVKVTGTIRGEWSPAAFVHYGTCNSDDVGYNYTLNFTKCSCDADIVSPTDGTATLIGHPYQGTGHTVTINVDSATDSGIDAAHQYNTTGKGNKYYCNCSSCNNITLNINGTAVTDENAKHGKIDAIKLNNINPVKGQTGYTITTAENAKKIRLLITAQLDAYDDTNTNVLKNLNGITMTLKRTDTVVSGNQTIDLLGNVKSINIDNTITGSLGYTLDNDGLFTIKTNTTANYVTGHVDITVIQYDSADKEIAFGTLKIAERAKIADSTWNIK